VIYGRRMTDCGEQMSEVGGQIGRQGCHPYRIAEAGNLVAQTSLLANMAGWRMADCGERMTDGGD